MIEVKKLIQDFEEKFNNLDDKVKNLEQKFRQDIEILEIKQIL
jgi:hypothetical protein